MSEPTRSYYAVLGVKPDASSVTIRNAYRAKARLVHPDSTSGAGSPEAMRELNEAWRVLGDPVKRQRYDAHRRSSSTVRLRHHKQQWNPLDHSVDDETIDIDDLDSGVPLDATSYRRLRFLTVGAVAMSIGAVLCFALAVLLQAQAFASLGITLLAISIGAFTMAPLYAMSRSRRKIDG